MLKDQPKSSVEVGQSETGAARQTTAGSVSGLSVARVPAWTLVAAAGVLLAVLRLTVPPGFAPLILAALGILTVGVLLGRAAHSSGRSRRVWTLFGLSLAAGVISMAVHDWLGAEEAAVLRTALDLTAYGLGAVGVTYFALDYRDAEPDTWLDAAAMGILLATVLFEVVPAPGGDPGGGSTVMSLVVAAFDAAILTTLVRIVIRPRANPSMSLLAAVVAVALILDAADSMTASGALISRPWYEAMWCVALTAMAAMSLHPDVGRPRGGAPSAERSIEVEIRSAMVAVAVFSAAMSAVAALLWHAMSTSDDAAAAVYLLGLFTLFVLAGLRSVRVVRRLAEMATRSLRAEEALRRSEDRFRRLAEVAPVGIFVSDADGRSLFQNEAWARAVGTTTSDGLGMGYAESIHPDDRDWAMASWLESVANEQPMEIQHRILRPDGTLRWVEANAVPLRDPAGTLTGWIGTVADVTTLVEARMAAQEREAFVVGLVEQSPVGIGVYGPDGTALSMNAALRRIRARVTAPEGGPEHEAEPGDSSDPGRPANDAPMPNAQSDPFMVRLGQSETIERVFGGDNLTPDPDSVHVAVRGADGADRDQWLRVTWFPLTGADARLTAVIAFVEDVTDVARADIERRRVESKLQESAKLEALGVLAGGIAHDFNNLLVAILGHASLARGSVEDGSEVAADLDAVETAARRAADLARQMLAYSGRGSFVVEQVSLDALVREIGDLLSSSIAKSAALEYEFSPDLPPVRGDVTQLRQVVMNLIVNASDALGSRPGTIKVRTGWTDLKARDTETVPGMDPVPGRYVMLEVSDTGAGMDSATRTRIFDPFFSTKATGRGLGLAATLGIVKGHGGVIRVRSRPGSGTRFQVLLRPTTADEQVVEVAPAAPVPILSGRILAVDDEPTARTLGRRVLERAGFSVAEACDGPEAIERFEAEPESFDGVLLDLTLPTLDGRVVLERIRAMRPDLPVVVCSGWAAEEVSARLGDVPGTTFLAKPYAADALVAAFARVPAPPVTD